MKNFFKIISAILCAAFIFSACSDKPKVTWAETQQYINRYHSLMEEVKSHYLYDPDKYEEYILDYQNMKEKILDAIKSKEYDDIFEELQVLCREIKAKLLED